MQRNLFIGAILASTVPTFAFAQDFQLSSPSVREGEKLTSAQVFNGFGCEGGNLSPELSWSNPPEGTRSFAITAYDPDAPTGSGWWHWNVVNIPTGVSKVEAGASGAASLPSGALELRNDYGGVGFGGACPPPGEAHRYVFTIYALGIDKLDLPEGASNALAGFMMRTNAIDQAVITAVYTR